MAIRNIYAHNIVLTEKLEWKLRNIQDLEPLKINTYFNVKGIPQYLMMD